MVFLISERFIPNLATYLFRVRIAQVRQMGSQLLTPIIWAIPWRFMDEMRRMTAMAMEGYGWPMRIHAQALGEFISLK